MAILVMLHQHKKGITQAGYLCLAQYNKRCTKDKPFYTLC